jgi:hypothetical protein
MDGRTTDGRTDGRTDDLTDGRTTDRSLSTKFYPDGRFNGRPGPSRTDGTDGRTDLDGRTQHLYSIYPDGRTGFRTDDAATLI